LAGHGILDIIDPKLEGGTAMSTSGSSRRAFIKTMGALAAGATCGCAAAAEAQDYKPQDQKKLTHGAARYQDQPKGNESCATCPYFILPKSCVAVEGEISPGGWCPIYTSFSPLDRGAHL
jgi:hypothetical protein